MSFPTGHALLIGVGSYLHHDMVPNLPNTVEDVRQLATILTDPQFCGYPPEQVTVLHNDTATRDGLLAALEHLVATTTADSTVLIYYAGHGHYNAPASTADRVYFLTTHETVLTSDSWVVPSTAVSQQELITVLQRLPAERVLLLFNACHAGELHPTMSLDAESAPSVKGSNLPEQTAAALLGTGSGRIIITACRDNQVSQAGGWSTTVFAHYLLETLQGEDVPSRDGYISVFDLYMTVYAKVKARVLDRYFQKQEPVLTILRGIGPFAVSLYPGNTPTMSAGTPLGGTLAPTIPVHAVSTADAQTALQSILNTTPLTQIGDNYRDTIAASDHGSITRDHAMIAANRSQQVRDEGIIMNAPQSQGAIGRAQAVTQHFGPPSTPFTSPPSTATREDVPLPSLFAVVGLFQPVLTELLATTDLAIQYELQVLELHLKGASVAVSDTGRRVKLEQALAVATTLAETHPTLAILRFVLHHMTR